MSIDLDSALSRLADQPLHPRLHDLEGDVMRLVATERRAVGVTLQSGALAAVGAIALGIAGGGFSSSAATAQIPNLTPFAPSTPLAPSTLLTVQ